MPVELVIGVVGLAVQIMETSSKIKEIIRTYKEAPRELQRLSLKIDHAESMCLHIKKLFEQENGLDPHATSLNEAVGVPILQSINATLDELGEMLVKFQRRVEGRSPLKSAGLAWMDKKERVRSLMGELESDLNILTQTMTSNIYSHVNVIRQQLVVQPTALQTLNGATDMVTSSSAPSEVAALALRNMMNPSGELVVSKTEEYVQQHQWPFSFSAKIKHQKVSKKTRWNDKIETDTVSETKSVTFSHPSLDRQLKFTYRFGSLCRPSYALTVPHIIDVRAPGFKVLGQALDTALWSDNVGAIQDMISTGQITPRTRLRGMWVGDYEDGGTLFEHAMVYSRNDLCHFLARQDPSVMIHDEDEVDWPDTSIMFHARNFNKRTLENILYLLAPSYHRSDPISLFNFLARPQLSPAYILYCYEFCRPQAMNRLSDLIKATVRMFHLAWQSVDGSWTPVSEASTDEWVALIMRLRDDGLEFHARISEKPLEDEFKDESEDEWSPISDRDSFVAFLSSMRRYLHSNPHKWEAALFDWLQVVENCGIDVKEYLEVERACCTETTRRIQFFRDEDADLNCVSSVPIVRSVYGLDIPTFEAQVVKEGPGNEICLEFTGLGLFWNVDRSTSFWDFVKSIVERETPPHQNWKIGDDWDHYHRWPFTEGLLASIDLGTSPRPNDNDSYRKKEWRQEWTYTKEDEQTIVTSFEYAEELREQRFQRHQRKRLCKMGLEEWPRKGKRAMPGAWVEGH